MNSVRPTMRLVRDEEADAKPLPFPLAGPVPVLDQLGGLQDEIQGLPAALLTMYIKRALVTKEVSATGYRLLDPSETLNRLNQALVDQALSQATYATALYGIVNTQTLEVCFSKGGHPAPALLYADG